MSVDYSKLKGRIVEICGTQMEFAKKMGISERTLSLKLSNKIAFRQDEIKKAIEILRLKYDDIPEYFFALKVKNFEQNAQQ